MPFVSPERIPATGHPRIDAGHRELAGAVNALYLLWQQQGSDEDLRISCQRLLRVVGRHFAEEEDIAAQANYPGIEEHAALHEALLSELTSRVENLESGPRFRRDLILDLFNVIEALIYEHEVMDDQDFWILFGKGDAPKETPHRRPMRWDQRLSIGLQEVDQQHQDLLMFVNRLLALIQAEAPLLEVLQAFEALFNHTRQHFAWEERYMAEQKLPEHDAHVLLHADLLSDLQNVMARVKSEGYQDLEGVIYNYLQYWLVDHILHVDCRLVRTVSQPTWLPTAPQHRATGQSTEEDWPLQIRSAK